jgi:serine/threonine protein kinase
MAPEMIYESSLSIKCDIFSLGVTVMELLTGRRYWNLIDQSFEQVRRTFQTTSVSKGCY